jgi:hypothetical protein
VFVSEDFHLDTPLIHFNRDFIHRVHTCSTASFLPLVEPRQESQASTDYDRLDVPGASYISICKLRCVVGNSF